MSQNEHESVDAFGQVLRNMAEHEDRLVNDRMNWFLAIQALLFTALSFAWTKNILLLAAICAIGVGVCLSSWFVVRCALQEIIRLSDRVEAKLAEYPDYDSPYERFGDGGLNRFQKFLLPWNFLPWLVTIAWVVILVAAITDGIASGEAVDCRHLTLVCS